MASKLSASIANAAKIQGVDPSRPGTLAIVTPPAAPPPVVTVAPSTLPPASPIDATSPTPSPSSPGVPDFLLKPIAPPPDPVPSTSTDTGDKDKNFAQLRHKAETAEARVKELEAKIAPLLDESGNLKIGADMAEKYAKIEGDLNKAYDQIAMFNVEADPRFNAVYNNKKAAVANTIDRMVKEFGGTDDTIAKASAMSLKERVQFLKGELPDAADLLIPQFLELDQIERARKEDLKNARVKIEQMKAQNKVEVEQNVVRVRNALHTAACRTMEEQGYFMFKEVPGQDEWNAQVRGVKQRGMEFLSSNDPQMQSMAMEMAASAPVWKALFEQRDARVRDLERQLKINAGAGASINANGSSSNTSSQIPANQMTAQSAAKSIADKLLKGAGLR